MNDLIKSLIFGLPFYATDDHLSTYSKCWVISLGCYEHYDIWAFVAATNVHAPSLKDIHATMKYQQIMTKNVGSTQMRHPNNTKQNVHVVTVLPNHQHQHHRCHNLVMDKTTIPFLPHLCPWNNTFWWQFLSVFSSSLVCQNNYDEVGNNFQSLWLGLQTILFCSSDKTLLVIFDKSREILYRRLDSIVLLSGIQIIDEW